MTLFLGHAWEIFRVICQDVHSSLSKIVLSKMCVCEDRGREGGRAGEEEGSTNLAKN